MSARNVFIPVEPGCYVEIVYAAWPCDGEFYPGNDGWGGADSFPYLSSQCLLSGTCIYLQE